MLNILKCFSRILHKIRFFCLTLYRYSDIIIAIKEMVLMVINDLLKQKGMTKYKLAKESKIPHTTVLDICSGKVNLKNCTGETLYKLAKVLDVDIERLLEDSMEYRQSFDAYKSNICHMVKDIGDINFIINTLESDTIRSLYQKKWYPECLYLLAMIDYLCKENDLPICNEYDDIRRTRLSEPVFPSSVIALSVFGKSEKPKKDSIKRSIPEFIRFNIVESEVRNVC